MLNRRPLQPGWGARPALAVGDCLHPYGKGPTLASSWPGTEQALSNGVLRGTRDWKCRVSLKNLQG